MANKIRELKAMLLRSGCRCEKAKGSYTKWKHPLLSHKLVISGKDGADAKLYQENDVVNYLREIGEHQ